MIRETPEMRARVNQLYEQAGGNLTPEMVIEDAKSPDSPLHSQFEWDVQKSAQQNWLNTAREIIRCIRVEVVEHHRTVAVTAYIHTGGQKPGYSHVSHIRSNRAQAMETLQQEFQCVANALRRAREIALGLGLESEVDQLMKLVGAREVVIIRRAEIAGRRPPHGTKPTRRARR